MNLLKKIKNKINSKFLNTFYRTIKLDKNSVIDYRCEIEQKNNILLGKKSILYKHTTIYKHKEGELSIGDFSHIAPYGYFLMEKQNLAIGDNVAIGPYCSIFCSTNSIPKDKKTLFKDSYDKGDVQIGNNVLIGTHCVILPHTVIGDGVVIAANSTVKGKLESGFLYGGNPAKKIKALGNE
ncbi:MAG: acyltransferase [Bacteroidales bacterium]|nr:acyltransferase [Bacteroidales bacterium]